MFGELALQEPRGQSRLLFNSPRGQEIGIAQLVRRHAEVAGLDLALLDQGAQHVVHATKAQTELGRDLALGQRRIGFQQAEEPEAKVFGDHGLSKAAAPRLAGELGDVGMRGNPAFTNERVSTTAGNGNRTWGVSRRWQPIAPMSAGWPELFGSGRFVSGDDIRRSLRSCARKLDDFERS